MNQVRNRRVVVSRHGGPDVLAVVEESLPEPGAGEVRVRVLAAGVSAFDLIYRRWGRLPGSPRMPFTLGEAVCLVVNFLTAHLHLHRFAGVRSGERVLVTVRREAWGPLCSG